jgi:histidinol dehydrogenase
MEEEVSEFTLPLYRWNELSQSERDARMHRVATSRRMFDPELREGVLEIVEDVRRNGDAAVVRATEKFDGVKLDAGRLRVSDAEFEAADEAIAGDLKEAIDAAIERVSRFSEHLIAADAHDWEAETEPGVVLGERFSPIASVGLSVPGGKGSFPSVLVQLGSPAKVAGVPEIVVSVPPLKDGGVDPAVTFVAKRLGITNLFRSNGPAGVAAMAFGTETFPQALKVVGPGSPPVAAAQIECQRFGTVIQMLLGPSESLVIADASADPDLVAADILNEAEHGKDSVSVLVAWDEELLKAVAAAVAVRIERLPEPRQGFARAALGENGGAYLVDGPAGAAEVADAFAAEHMQLDVSPETAEELLPLLHHAGEILIGNHATVSAANYLLGVPAALPTGRFARVTSGVTVDAFLKRTSTARVDEAAMKRLAPAVIALAEHEGFPAHAETIRARLG